METNPTAFPSSSIARNGDLYDGTVDRQQSPERCGTLVAEHGSLAASEHCRHPACLDREAAMPHRIDAAVNPVQSPTAHTMPNAMLVEASLAKLRN